MSWLDRTVIALDFNSPEKAYEIIDTLDEQIQWYKIGPVLYTQSGPDVIQYLHKKKKKIFLDLKLHDKLVTIGRLRVFSLGGWSPHIQTGLHVPRPTCRTPSSTTNLSHTGLSPSMANLSRLF